MKLNDDLERNFNVYNDENRRQIPWVPSTLVTIDVCISILGNYSWIIGVLLSRNS